MRTALDRAAAGIGGKFQNQPVVEASIRQTIGSTYTGLSLYADAGRCSSSKCISIAVSYRCAFFNEHTANSPAATRQSVIGSGTDEDCEMNDVPFSYVAMGIGP